MPTSPTSIRSLGFALLLSLAVGPALADRVVGDWTVAPYEGALPTRCIAANRSDENGAVLTAIVGTYGDIQFVLARPTMAMTVGDRPSAEFLIDGRTIALRETKALDRQTVQFVGEAGGRNQGALLRGLERGSVAVVQLAGQRSTFTLDATANALALLSRCVADPSAVASSTVGTCGDITEKEAALEQEGDAVEALGAGGDPMAALLDGQAAFAQLRCSVPTVHLMGVFGGDARPLDFDISINPDATASVNGTTIAPLAQRAASDGSGPSVGIYRASEVYGALVGTSLGGLFADAPRPPQDAFEKGFSNS